MANKKPVKGVDTPKYTRSPRKRPKKAIKKKVTKRKASKKKKSGKPRKLNRYMAIRSAVSKYCRETYGKPCPNKEMNRIYWELKARYDDVPIEKVLDEIDFLLSEKDSEGLPTDATKFDWFNLDTLLFRSDGLYFHSGDRIVLDMRSMGLGIVEGLYGNMPLIWLNDIYPTLRGRTYEAEANGWSASPLPAFIFDKEASDVKGRKYVWRLGQSYVEQDYLDAYVWQDNATGSSRGVPQADVPRDAVRLEELKTENAKLRAAELLGLKEMYNDKVFTREEYAAMVKEVYGKFAKGGVV